jgi:hypothetical protein
MIINTKLKKYFILKPVNGLANRLRVLFSYKVIADYLKLPFYVYWENSSGFDDTDILDLISNPTFNFVDKKTWESSRLESFKIDRKISNTSEFIVDEKINKNTQTSILLNNSFSKITGEVSNLPNWSFGSALQIKIPNHKQLYKSYLRTLEVSNKIKKSAETTLGKFTENTIGIHIRCGDAMDERNNKHNLYQTHTDNTELMEYIRTHVGNVFLSTDDENVLSYFKSKFKDKIIFYPKKFQISNYGETKHGQYDAMVDLYLLSRTQFMIPMSPSSFSKFASDLGGNLYQKCQFKYLQDNKILDVVNW